MKKSEKIISTILILLGYLVITVSIQAISNETGGGGLGALFGIILLGVIYGIKLFGNQNRKTQIIRPICQIYERLLLNILELKTDATSEEIKKGSSKACFNMASR